VWVVRGSAVRGEYIYELFGCSAAPGVYTNCLGTGESVGCILTVWVQCSPWG